MLKYSNKTVKNRLLLTILFIFVAGIGIAQKKIALVPAKAAIDDLLSNCNVSGMECRIAHKYDLACEHRILAQNVDKPGSPFRNLTEASGKWLRQLKRLGCIKARIG